MRKGEARPLRWADIDLKGLCVRIPAAVAKSRRTQSGPLRADLAESLRTLKGSALPTAPVSPRWAFPTHRTLQADLAAAGIAKMHAEGRHVDFHSLRVGMVSALAAAGVHPREAQVLARHASVELTLKTYTDPRMLNVRGALERLAASGAPAGEGAATSPAALSRELSRSPDLSVPLLAATGTDGFAGDLALNAPEGGVERQVGQDEWRPGQDSNLQPAD